MPTNTTEFGQFVRSMRNQRWNLERSERGVRRPDGLVKPASQSDIQDAGGPHRGALGDIEAGKPVDLTPQTLDQIDTGMAWPSNLSRQLLSDNLPVNVTARHFDDIAELHRRSHFDDPIIGFDVNGKPASMPPQLTTTLHRHLVLNVASAWRRTTLIDLSAYDHADYRFHLKDFIDWWAQRVNGTIYTTTETTMPAEGIVVDPVFEIDRLRQAESLIDALGADATPTKDRARIGLTLLWAAAQARLNGESAFRVLTDLSVAQHDLSARTASLAKFRAAWRKSELSATASDPAWDAVDLFAGILQGADTLTDVHIHPHNEEMTFTPTAPTVTPALNIYRDINPAIVLYDSRINPEMPAVLAWTGGPSLPILTITADQTRPMPTLGHTIRLQDPLPSDPPRGDDLGPYCGLNPYGGQPRLDGWFGDRTLILIEAGKAQRIYFPPGLW